MGASLTKDEINFGKSNRNYEQYMENSFKRTNMILTKPKGWIIMDSFNNKYFPVKEFEVDSLKFNSGKLKTYFTQHYGGNPRDLFLPWHYIVELVEGEQPFVMNTRPFNYKSGFKGYEQYLTIMIIGNSNNDIYPGRFYKQIAHMIMNPMAFMKGFFIPNESSRRLYWTGTNFKKEELELHLY